MNIAGAVVIFLIWWWIVFLAVLPRDIKGRWEASDDGVKGADPGAPVSPQIGKKAWMATKITFFVWIATIAVIMSGLFNFRN